MLGQKKVFQSVSLIVSIFAVSTISLLISITITQANKKIVSRPTIATVKDMINGDLMCYIDIIDDKGRHYKSVGASFDLCANEKTFLNKKVRLYYSKVSVNYCQSIEPCGRTRLETLITKMQIIR